MSSRRSSVFVFLLIEPKMTADFTWVVKKPCELTGNFSMLKKKRFKIRSLNINHHIRQFVLHRCWNSGNAGLLGFLLVWRPCFKTIWRLQFWSIAFPVFKWKQKNPPVQYTICQTSYSLIHWKQCFRGDNNQASIKLII